MSPAVYGLGDVRGAIIVLMRSQCTKLTPASSSGRVDTGEDIMRWPIHVNARVTKRLSPETVRVHCPRCHYTWEHHSSTAKRGNRPWAEYAALATLTGN